MIDSKVVAATVTDLLPRKRVRSLLLKDLSQGENWFGKEAEKRVVLNWGIGNCAAKPEEHAGYGPLDRSDSTHRQRNRANGKMFKLRRSELLGWEPCHH